MVYKDLEQKSKTFSDSFCKRSPASPWAAELIIYGKITPYQLLRVNYKSTITWCLETDLLRANPNFFHQPRYDFVLVKVYDNVHLFAQLQYIFGITIEEQIYYMALILPLLDEPIPRHERSRDDTDLRLARLRARPRKHAVFINVESIVRGALLTRDHDSNFDEFFLITTIDQDMWWRNKSLVLPSKRAEI